MSNHAVIKRELVRYARRMYEKGLVAGKEGNLSAGADDGSVWVTPAGVNKGDVTEEQLARVSLEGEILEGSCRPTSERTTHLEVYRQRPDARAAVDGHPVFCTTIAAAHRPLPSNILPEIVAVIGEIPLVPHGTPSSAKLTQVVAPYRRRHDCFLPANHGALALGASVEDPYHGLEVLEAYARIALYAEHLGGVKTPDASSLADLPRPSYGVAPAVP